MYHVPSFPHSNILQNYSTTSQSWIYWRVEFCLLSSVIPYLISLNILETIILYFITDTLITSLRPWALNLSVVSTDSHLGWVVSF